MKSGVLQPTIELTCNMLTYMLALWLQLMTNVHKCNANNESGAKLMVLKAKAEDILGAIFCFGFNMIEPKGTKQLLLTYFTITPRLPYRDLRCPGYLLAVGQ